MPLPKKSEVKDYDDCVSKTYKVEKNAGKSEKEARAIALDHCGKLFHKNQKEIEKKLEEIKELLDDAK